MNVALRKIEQVTARPDYKLSVLWTDGRQMIVDFSNDIKSAGVWQALQNYSLFSKVRVTQGGYAIEWPEPADEDGDPQVDIDSEGLYRLAVNQLLGPHIGMIAERLAP